MRISMLTSIGFCLNAALDKNEAYPFTINDFYHAWDKGKIVDLLQRTIDPRKVFSSWTENIHEKAEVEHALAEASEGMIRSRHEIMDRNPLCLLNDIVLEAIQLNF